MVMGGCRSGSGSGAALGHVAGNHLAAATRLGCGRLRLLWALRGFG